MNAKVGFGRRRMESVAAQVLDQLRLMITSGALQAGARLDQKNLCEELGVSLIPIREALRQLEAEGLVETQPYRGAYVASLSMTDLMDIYVTREVLEDLATRLAVPRMGADVLAVMLGLIEGMERATAEGDRAALFDLNADYHFTIYRASENAILCGVIDGLWQRSTIYRRVFTFMPERGATALQEHRDILAACQAGDADAAGQAVRLNVAQTTRAIGEAAARASREGPSGRFEARKSKTTTTT